MLQSVTGQLTIADFYSKFDLLKKFLSFFKNFLKKFLRTIKGSSAFEDRSLGLYDYLISSS